MAVADKNVFSKGVCGGHGAPIDEAQSEERHRPSYSREVISRRVRGQTDLAENTMLVVGYCQCSFCWFKASLRRRIESEVREIKGRARALSLSNPPIVSKNSSCRDRRVGLSSLRPS